MSDTELLDRLQAFYYAQNEVLRHMRTARNFDLMGQPDMVWHCLFDWLRAKDSRDKKIRRLGNYHLEARQIMEGEDRDES